MNGPELLQRIQAALARLPRRDREIFLAVRVDGLSYEEVARQRGCSARKVERTIARVLVALDRELHG